MIKSELVTKLAEQTNLTKTDAENIVTTVFREITKALVKGNRVELRGFGVLSVRERKPRVGRNPKTGEKHPQFTIKKPEMISTHKETKRSTSFREEF